jgi:hypothetical protein
MRTVSNTHAKSSSSRTLIDWTEIMPPRRHLLFTAACLLAMLSFVMPSGLAPAAAGDAAATALVTKIYDAYKGKNASGVMIDTEAQLRLYFEPSLVALIVKDQKAAAKRHEVPTLDGDPFVSAQDWEITAFDITVTDAPPDKATATVSFKNVDTPVKVVLNLVKIKNEWRIADIVTTQQGTTESLRGLFRH